MLLTSNILVPYLPRPSRFYVGPFPCGKKRVIATPAHPILPNPDFPLADALDGLPASRRCRRWSGTSRNALSCIYIRSLPNWRAGSGASEWKSRKPGPSDVLTSERQSVMVAVMRNRVNHKKILP
ncbi:hypothetical protein GWI33_015447 [Rhynchophorus ferrugineus]|uniref:Uncharacterized protein n=1 Tax=Rhynchophorus ferrugineus TaxID=354439 RepID=A0A834I3B3_RHYFE|nr:hypothetical protein GWI33_015447 [Rhynchophorus ferrugineus]